MHNTTTFQLKGSLFTLTVLRMKSVDLDTLQTELSNTIAKAPKFFENAPVVVDLQPIAQINPPLNFVRLIEILKSNQLIPIGVRNGSDQHHIDAIAAGLALLPNIKTHETTSFSDKNEKPDQKSTTKTQQVTEQNESVSADSLPATPTKIITQPIRSGKQVYVQGGDLLVLAPVSHGAEILADGNIHVYGPLRGRALAGVRGDTNARIFCQELDAELVSIAGHYKISDELEDAPKEEKGLKHIFLEDEELKVEAI